LGSFRLRQNLLWSRFSKRERTDPSQPENLIIIQLSKRSKDGLTLFTKDPYSKNPRPTEDFLKTLTTTTFASVTVVIRP
jgi:hypothetical protein